jgi:hypothetical protein
MEDHYVQITGAFECQAIFHEHRGCSDERVLFVKRTLRKDPFRSFFEGTFTLGNKAARG